MDCGSGVAFWEVRSMTKEGQWRGNLGHVFKMKEVYCFKLSKTLEEVLRKERMMFLH